MDARSGREITAPLPLIKQRRDIGLVRLTIGVASLAKTNR
jgi:hypothetical protein